MLTLGLAWISAKYKVKYDKLYIVMFFLDIALFAALGEIF